MSRGHIRVGRAFGAVAQENVLRAAGVKTLYKDDIDAAIKSCRNGEALWVVGLRGLASSRTGIENAVYRLHAKRAWAVDAVTMCRSDGPDGAILMSRAIKDLANERLGGHAAARADGAKGGAKAGRNRRAKKMPAAMAEKIWHDKTLTNAEAIEKIADACYQFGWSASACYKNFGKRAVKVGRPANV